MCLMQNTIQFPQPGIDPETFHHLPCSHFPALPPPSLAPERREYERPWERDSSIGSSTRYLLDHLAPSPTCSVIIGNSLQAGTYLVSSTAGEVLFLVQLCVTFQVTLSSAICKKENAFLHITSITTSIVLHARLRVLLLSLSPSCMMRKNYGHAR